MNLKTQKFNDEFVKIKPIIYQRDKWECMYEVYGKYYFFYIERHSPKLTVDHIIPRSMPDLTSNKKENLITLCPVCHNEFTNMPLERKVKILREIMTKAYGYKYEDRFTKLGITFG